MYNRKVEIAQQLLDTKTAHLPHLPPKRLDEDNDDEDEDAVPSVYSLLT